MAQEARLIQKTGVKSGREIPLSDTLVLGRGDETNFPIEDERASRRHLELRPERDGWVVIDLQSSNGTFLNGTRLAPSVPFALESGSKLQLGDTVFLFGEGARASNPLTQSVQMQASFVIGRAPDCDLVISSTNVSRQHCRILKTPAGWLLEDLQSHNGTYLNGVRVLVPETLRPDDQIALDSHRFIFRNGTLEHFDQGNTVRLDVENLHHVVRKDGQPLTLLNSVTVVIPPKEFVVIVGGTGAGKTTLLNTMAGLHPATGGTVRLNGVDLYRNLTLFRTVMGYVPQENVVHKELRVGVALRYAAELRLPPDIDAKERERLIDATLQDLGLSHRKDSFVSTLSGGELKRVSVAMELLSRPSLLFMDEPTAGLDPATEKEFITIIKRLTEEGHTVVMVTHSPLIISKCNKMLFLAKGGHVAFYGSHEEALDYVGEADIAEAFTHLKDDPTPPHLQEQKYLQTDYCRRYIMAPLANAPRLRKDEAQGVVQSLGATEPRLDTSGQFYLLLRRYADTLRGDPLNLLLLLGQAPLLALALVAVFPADLFDPLRFAKGILPGSISVTPPSLLCSMVIGALLFGVLNAATEITKEGDIYKRERMVNLQPLPYLLSKVSLLSVLCIIQSVLMVGVLRLKIDFHLNTSGYMILIGILVLMTLSSSLLGLLMSSYALATTKPDDRMSMVSKANTRVMKMIPLVAVLQIVFSGLVEVESLNAVGKIMPSYWAFAALGNLTQLNETMFRFLGSPKEQFTILPSWAAFALCVIGAVYALITYVFLVRKQ